MTRDPAPPLTRRNVLLGAAFLALPSVARAKPCPPARVLFVCPAGSVKSAIAREYLKAAAAKRGVPVLVQSRGVHPEDHVSSGLAANLASEGIDPGAEPLRRFTQEDVRRADIVIAFDEAAKEPGLTQARAWDIPSWNSQFAEARAALASRIDALLNELSARGCSPT